jgi:hypothetical protein
VKRKLLAGAILGGVALHGQAMAEMSTEERLNQMEQRMRHMERRLAAQDRAIQDKDKLIAQLQRRSEDPESSGSWFKGIAVGGSIEVEGSYTDNDVFGGNEASDLNVSTAELDIEAGINDWTTANLVLLWEEEDGSGNELTVDQATITIAESRASPFYLVAGHLALPFGRYETLMVSDPFTLELGETKETALIVGAESHGLFASAYGFNGDLDDGTGNTIDNYGADLGYAWGGDGRSVYTSLSYINDLGDSDGISDVVIGNLTAPARYERKIPGYALHALVTAGPVSLIGEYVTATKGFDSSNEIAFNGRGAKPSAWNLEAGYTFDAAGHETALAVGHQETGEALGLGLPRSRTSATVSVALMEDTTFSLEWTHDRDYGTGDSDAVAGAVGTGDESNTLTGQLAVGF